ncbi:pyridoxamine 5'-phosphate oxidase [Candidatus Puniceispirillum marinum]|uniref:Pyridoxine/pyridoxamine 5'-phosphate oxidase n=1 Tax=Puniceispirillum marinum (strain IMCC1322) TaxID=488538 RepID=D5BSQ6_PUNMI|nr:pyridoxamine 5'-phosphate oxidase [Candidatus Puniceispirillum marinum]ADE39303.1 pyridoxamine 5'-phosphate oxidase [Candidatus Puniceispirillum marinum IMCC1322]
MEIVAGTDPFGLFQTWFDEAVKAEINDPDAVALASVDANGMPSVRIVLLKEWSPAGFVIYTNYESRKADELLATGKAAFCIHWKSLRRQVRVVGSVSKADPVQSDAYFASRGRGSQIGAWASAQSRPLTSRDDLAAQVRVVEDRFPDIVTRPPHWGGFSIDPQEIEFWADGEHRLHDRFRFTANGKAGWDIQRLNP